jgi:hypothetical protein
MGSFVQIGSCAITVVIGFVSQSAKPGILRQTQRLSEQRD